MSSPLLDRLRRARRWLIPAALLALIPKCFACLAVYAGLGAALFGGVEICGAASNSIATTLHAWPLLLAVSLAALATIRHRARFSAAPVGTPLRGVRTSRRAVN